MVDRRMLVVGAVAAVLLLGGCAAIKQGIVDYKIGKETPVAEGEKSPQDATTQVVSMVSALPVVGPYAGFIAPVVLGFLTWKRGNRIRKGEPLMAPITGAFGPKIGVGAFNLENGVQMVTDIFKGGFEVGPDGSVVKRTWKIWLSVLLAAGSGALFIPGVREFLLSNAQVVVTIGFLSGLFGGLEKKLQEIKPSTV